MLRSLTLVLLCLIPLTSSLSARTRRGDILIDQARRAEAKDTTADLDLALKLANEALATDRLDTGYQLEVARIRAFAAQYHVYDGQLLRDRNHKLKEAIAEFGKAAELDPASAIAPEEARRTQIILDKLAASPNLDIEELLLRPLPLRNKREEEKFETTAPVAQLRAKLSHPLPIIKVNNQSSNEVFLALCKQAGVRVLFDSDFQSRGLGLNQVVDFHGLSLAQALDYLALITKSFWKPLSGDTIFVSNDDPQRRGAYEEQITKAFYLTNAPVAQDVLDIGTTVQKVTDIRKLFIHPTQNVIIARSDPDRVALAGKVIADLDKARAEIIVDVIILSVTKDWIRTLGVDFEITGANTNAIFSPPTPVGATAPVAGSRVGIPLSSLAKLAAGDYNLTLPGAALNALLETRGTKVLDKAQLRTVEGQKSTIRIGQKVPYATGSFSPGSVGGTNALVNTQFQYFDVGLNIDVIAKVHEPDEVSLHIESDTSSVAESVDLGGFMQPVISQRKRVADVRVKEGEVNFWDVVTDRQDVRNTSGVPGLSQIPLLGRLFTNEHIEKSELQVLTLLIPHIIRAPDIRDVNLMSISSGSDQVVRLRYTREDHGSETEEPVTVEMPPGNAVNTPLGTLIAPTAPGTALTNPFAATPPPAASTGARLGFDPPQQSATVNGTVVAALSLRNAVDVGDSTVIVQFDPKVLTLMGIAPGAMLTATDITAAPGQKLEDGIVLIKLGKPGGPAVQTSGGPLATFNFKAVNRGSITVSTIGSRIVNTKNQEIPVQTDSLTIAVQ